MAFSIGEVFVIFAVGSWAFGPKELPRIGKTLGKLTGKATGFVYRARSQLFNFAEKTELTKVQEELQATMYQLNVIRSELQGGINILDPGPLTRRILGQGGINSGELIETNSANISNGTGLKSAPSSLFEPSFASSPIGNVNISVPPPKAQLLQAFQNTDGSGIGANDTINKSQTPELQYKFKVLPVSAMEAGLVPNRVKATPTGSEMLADALQEEKVAEQALRFFEQHTVIADSSPNRTMPKSDGDGDIDGAISR